MSAEVPTPPQAKYTRYRSVRQSTANKPPPSAPASATKKADGHSETIQRSRSRYHRRPGAASTQAQPPLVPVPILPAVPQPIAPLQAPLAESDTSAPNHSKEQKPIHYTNVIDLDKLQKAGTIESLKSDSRARGYSERSRAISDGPGGAKDFVGSSLNDQYQMEDPQPDVDGEAVRILAEQKRKDLERLEMELSAAAAKPSGEVSSPVMDKSGAEKLGIFALTRAKWKGAPSKSSSSETGSDSKSEDRSQKLAKEKIDDAPRNILQGGGGVVPGTDAPKSAVNAGERRVLIRSKQSSINLPINPETTPVDIIKSAANILTHAIAPSASILLESYTKLGLERRVRRYEHIRDIMNSWDRDTQNALIIQASDTPSHDFDLNASSVPKEQPNDVQVYMYHSQKPGKWNKRYITLMSTGQIFISKKQSSIVSDKDITTLCHLTDFDIYTPTTQEIRRNLRPPKKYCYAIKSQQKTNMFLDTVNFVHYFSTDDYNVATTWYDACQQWRSWYLVHMMGEGRKKAAPKTRSIKVPDVRMPSGNRVAGHRINVSVDDEPYTIGSFQPLLDPTRFNTDDEEEENRPRQIPFHLRHGTPPAEPHPRRDRNHHPPSVFSPRHLHPSGSSDPPEYTPTADDPNSTFVPTSLLGRTYTQRQRTVKERELASDDGPFTNGPSLLNRGRLSIPGAPKASPEPPSFLSTRIAPGQEGHTRTNSTSTRRPHTSSGAAANNNNNSTNLNAPSSSLRRPTLTQTPLIDLTPKFIEAPQWNRDGKGRGVAAPDGVPLVEAATGPSLGPDHAMGVPEVLFRRS